MNNSLLEHLNKFIRQADESVSQKKKGYLKDYEGLKVNVSFGGGKMANIPWISFLAEDQTTSNGIYPIFLYYKKQSLLILSYGISDSKEPRIKWQLPQSTQTINQYFQAHNLGKPAKYGKSYVSHVYRVPEEITNDIDTHLNEIITQYKAQLSQFGREKAFAHDDKKNLTPITMYLNDPFDIHSVTQIQQTGLYYTHDLLYRYALSLLTKPFVILSGLSGSGKTQLAITFARWMSMAEDQVKIVSVGSDWTNREYLLGYPNALDPGKYIHPENGVLQFLLDAARNPTKPYFLILDEMNLSYVERYFADFLSAMESGDYITLHPDTPEWQPKTKTLKTTKKAKNTRTQPITQNKQIQDAIQQLEYA